MIHKCILEYRINEKNLPLKKDENPRRWATVGAACFVAATGDARGFPAGLPSGREMDIAVDLAVGSFAGAVGVLVGHPLDVIKVRMQQSPQYRSMLDCAVKTARGEGPLGFLKGVGPPLASVAAYQAVCFASFNMALSAITTDSEDDASMGTVRRAPRGPLSARCHRRCRRCPSMPSAIS